MDKNDALAYTSVDTWFDPNLTLKSANSTNAQCVVFLLSALHSGQESVYLTLNSY